MISPLIGMTKKACYGQQAEIEAIFSLILPKIVTLEIKSDKLYAYDRDHAILMISAYSEKVPSK